MAELLGERIVAVIGDFQQAVAHAKRIGVVVAKSWRRIFGVQPVKSRPLKSGRQSPVPYADLIEPVALDDGP